MRSESRNFLVAFIGVTVICVLYVSARDLYHAERRHAESLLSEVIGISNIQLNSTPDLAEEINSSRFTVDEHPGSIVEIGGLGDLADKGGFSVRRIGKWAFRVTGCRHLGIYNKDTGDPVESIYYGDTIRLGPNNPYKHLFPFEVNTLQDLADHYGELVELLESWPREAEPGTVTLDDGTTETFYVIENDQ